MKWRGNLPIHDIADYDRVIADYTMALQSGSVGLPQPRRCNAYLRGPFFWPLRPALVLAVPSIIGRVGFRGLAALKGGIAQVMNVMNLLGSFTLTERNGFGIYYTPCQEARILLVTSNPW